MNTQQTRRIAQTALVIVLEAVAASSIGVAQSANAREERSKSALLEAASLQSNAKGERRIENRAEADRLLRQVLVEGTTEQKALAANNLGALLHEDNRNGEAVAVFRAIPFDALKPEQAVVYRYNFARTLQATGEQLAAYDQFVEAIKLQSTLSIAVEAAFKINEELGPTRLGNVRALVELLLERNQIGTAGERTKYFLNRWANHGADQQLLAELVHYYVAAGITAQAFNGGVVLKGANQQTEWQFLTTLARKAPQLQGPINGIGRAYLCQQDKCVDPNGRQVLQFVQMFNRAEAEKLFPYWTQLPWQREPFSRLLKMLGDHWALQQNRREALVRYTAAWFVNPNNTEAALFMATILREDGRAYDPQSRLYSQLTQAYEAKNAFEKFVGILTKPLPGGGDVAAKSVLARETNEEIEQIMQIYLLLGSAQNNHRLSVLLQAARAEDRLQQRTNAEVAPGLHVELGNAYARVGDVDEAKRQYSLAIDAFQRNGNLELAESIRRSLQGLAAGRRK